MFMDEEKKAQLKGRLLVILAKSNGRAEKVEEICDTVDEVLSGVPSVQQDEPEEEKTDEEKKEDEE